MPRFDRLAHRIGAAVGLPLALMVGAALVAAVQLRGIDLANDRIDEDRERATLVSSWVGHVRINLDRAILATRLDAAAGDDESARSRLAPVVAALNEAMATAAEAATRTQARMGEQARAERDDIETLVAQVAQDRTRFVSVRAQIRDDLLLGEGLPRIDAELVPLATTMAKSLDALQAHIGARTAEAAATLSAKVRQAQWLLFVCCLVALATGGVMAWRITRSIVAPVRRAVDFARSIAEGRLDGLLGQGGPGELGQLAQSLNAMRDALAQLVGQVRQSADGIHLASAEVASGNADLSHRTEHAAGSLQHTASSMEQLTGTVRQSGEAAAQANELASSACAVAGRGGQVVSQVVETMQQINTSSHRIADIISVIDGIAFQTNILALNAAVEAARAGDHGRGFAVVAAEVRSLAQRSAGAAKEIKDLIGASVERVQAGTRLVSDAGATMNEIVASVKRVNDIIGEITASSSEQGRGIGQINAAVNELDRMTQQNAALVEQSAAAAESLKDQAQRLTSLVATFRLASTH